MINKDQRIEELEKALRAIVDARNVWIATIGQVPVAGYGPEDKAWAGYLAALDKAEKVLNG